MKEPRRFRIPVRDVPCAENGPIEPSNGADSEKFARERFDYSTYQSCRPGRRSIAIVFHEDRQPRPSSEDMFYGKFRVSFQQAND